MLVHYVLHGLSLKVFPDHEVRAFLWEKKVPVIPRDKKLIMIMIEIQIKKKTL